MLQYDSTHGRWPGEVSLNSDGKSLNVDGRDVEVHTFKAPEEINWAASGAEYIIESTGVFTSIEGT